MLHKMMNPLDSYYYEYCIAGKTGYTDQAGTTLVTYCKKGELELISVIMDSYFTQYDDTIALMNYGFNNFTMYDMADASGASAVQSQRSLLAAVLPSSSSLISIERGSNIILPVNETLDSVKSVISYSDNQNESNGYIATITYYYDDMKIGNALLKFSSGETTSAFEYANIAIEPDTTDDIFSSEGKLIITYQKLLIYIVIAIVFILLVILAVVYFRPKKVRHRLAERNRKKRLRRRYYD